METRAKAAVGLAALAAAIGVIAWLSSHTGSADHVRGPIGSLGASSKAKGLAAEVAASASASATTPGSAIHPRPFDARSESGPAWMASRPAEPRGSIDLHVVWGDDKAPAPAVGVHVVEWGSRSGMRKQHDEVTGGDGSVRLGSVVAGRVQFSIERGGSGTVELVEGKAAELTLEIPPGRTVAGTVVDPDDKPVPDADVWLWATGKRREGAVVARTDAKGEFSVRSVSPARMVAARESSHAPSDAFLIAEGPLDQPVNVRLQLGGMPGSIYGAVSRSDGSLVADATIQVEPDWGAGSSVSTTGRADDSGRFAIDGLQPGSNVVAVFVGGLPAWTGDVHVKPGEATPLMVSLPLGAVVAGAVKDASGAPVSGASIRVGSSSALRSWMTSSRADGSFRLEGLAAGTIEIRADFPDVFEAHATATLDCEDGAEVRWDPVLDTGLQIVGFVRDDRDEPLAGWTVEARSLPPGVWGKSVTTDVRGRFEVHGCRGGDTFSLEARPGPSKASQAVLDRVTPGAEERLLRVCLASLITVRGRILGADGRPEAAGVRLMSRSSRIEIPTCAQTDSQTGLFSLGPVLPGRWGIVVDRIPLGSEDLGDREIAPGSTVDLGDVKLPKMGSLLVELPDTASLPEWATYEIQNLLPTSQALPDLWGYGPQIFRSSAGDLPSPLALGPGRYCIMVYGGLPGEREMKSQTFDVTAGQETRVRLSLEPAESK